MPAQPNLVRRPVPIFTTANIEDRLSSETVVTREVDYEALEIRELLQQAQDMSAVIDPASSRLNRIKSALITKVSPIYDANNQLQLFNNDSGYVIRDPLDNQQIIVTHPDIPIQFRIKKTTATQWKVVGRTIGQEIERRTALIAQETNTSEESFQRGFRSALEWVLEQTQARVTHRTTSRFVAAPESQGRV